MPMKGKIPKRRSVKDVQKEYKEKPETGCTNLKDDPKAYAACIARRKAGKR